MLGFLAVFAVVFAAEFAGSLIDGWYQDAVRRRQMRARLVHGFLLQLLGWADYLGADRFSLLAALPGSLLGSLAGDWLGARRSMIDYRMTQEEIRDIWQITELEAVTLMNGPPDDEPDDVAE